MIQAILVYGNLNHSNDVFLNDVGVEMRKLAI